MKSGAQILIEGLKEQGVDVIFGYPGGVVLPLYDELYDSDIRHILVRHEQAAIHAAGNQWKNEATLLLRAPGPVTW